MRPNIDIANQLHQQVKDIQSVTEAEDLSEAYIKTLKAGLQQYPNPTYASRVDSPTSSFNLDTVNYTRYIDEQAFQNIIWTKFMFGTKDEIVTFGGGGGSMSRAEFEQKIRSVTPYLVDNAADSRFSIAQVSGQWVGEGIWDFIEALKNQDARYDRDSPRETHDREKGIFIARISPGGLLVLYVQNRVGKDLVENIGVQFLTDGIPLQTEGFSDIASIFGTSLGHARSTTRAVDTIVGDQFRRIDADDIVDLFVDSSGIEDYITGLKIKNPITEEDVEGISENKQRALLEPEEIICHLGHHQLLTDHERHGTKFYIKDLKIRTLPTSRDPLYRVQCFGGWQSENKEESFSP